MLRGIAICATVALAACATYKKPLPAIGSPRPAAKVVPFKFSDRERLLKLTRLVSDLPAGCEYGEYATTG